MDLTKGQWGEINQVQMTIVSRSIMPQGKVDFKLMTQFTPIKVLAAEHGEGSLIKALFLLIQNFCSSINVVRNMDIPQMADAAAFLLDECESCRLEDYQAMFIMAKRGQLTINDGKGIMDRIDISIISQIYNSYMNLRAIEGQRLLEQRDHELRMQRLNNQQKQIATGEKTFIVVPDNHWENELAKLKQAIEQQKDQSLKEFYARAPQRKRELLNLAANAWGVTPQEIYTEMKKIPDAIPETSNDNEPPQEGQIIIK